MKKVVTLYPEKENIPMSKRKLRVAAYCRVSTDHEEQDGSIELQENFFRMHHGNRYLQSKTDDSHWRIFG